MGSIFKIFLFLLVEVIKPGVYKDEKIRDRYHLELEPV